MICVSVNKTNYHFALCKILATEPQLGKLISINPLWSSFISLLPCFHTHKCFKNLFLSVKNMQLYCCLAYFFLGHILLFEVYWAWSVVTRLEAKNCWSGRSGGWAVPWKANTKRKVNTISSSMDWKAILLIKKEAKVGWNTIIEICSYSPPFSFKNIIPFH